MSESRERPGAAPDPRAGPIESRVVHDGRVVHLSVDRVRFPDGTVGEVEIIRHRGASAIVPIMGSVEDPDPVVILIRQYRYAAGGYVLEIPAGIPLDGESWEDCARRELEEETGFVAKTLQPLTRFFTTPGFTNEEIHLFLGTGLERGAVRRDRDEFIEVVELPFPEVMDLVREGGIRDGKSLIGLLFFDGFRRGRE